MKIERVVSDEIEGHGSDFAFVCPTEARAVGDKRLVFNEYLKNRININALDHYADIVTLREKTMSLDCI